MKRGANVSTQALAISLWKSREVQCLDDPSPSKLRPTSKTRTNTEYHEDFGHATSKCRELKKALHEMADQGQLNPFLKQRKGANQNQRDAQPKRYDDSNQNTVVIATITGVINVKEMIAGIGTLKFGN